MNQPFDLIAQTKLMTSGLTYPHESQFLMPWITVNTEFELANYFIFHKCSTNGYLSTSYRLDDVVAVFTREIVKKRRKFLTGYTHVNLSVNVWPHKFTERRNILTTDLTSTYLTGVGLYGSSMQ